VISDVPSSRIGDGIEEFIADGIILMESQYNSGTLERRIRVLKMRGTEHTLKTHKYRIDREKGLTDITAE